ncbi:hypothetical protein [Nocardioides sp. ChNu-99]|uniref:hypothetical protein n=1 Tax=Nocardioides sp. ChNu-99 TaxID=2839897 RepID=UPI002404E73F|nr:hypothetical protein [Nocardioides sp. ChNu-99]MDF9716458.1 hypothetical protein [Nocardioides sp. ChNu-99]
MATTTPPPRPAWSPATSAIDEILFRPGNWFAIDAHNRAVPGIVIADLPHGLELLDASRAERGPIATIVGRLVDHARGVDIDVHGPHGYRVQDQLTGWATAHGIWHLTRPSGGANGRAHVYLFAAPDQLDDLTHGLPDYIRDLRTEHALPAKALEARTAIRPLSAPHRTGRYTKPEGPLAQRQQHLTQINARLQPAPPTEGTRARTGAHANPAAPSTARNPARNPLPDVAPNPAARTGGSAGTAGGVPSSRPRARRGSVVALAPLARRRRDLPALWRAYLTHGVRPIVGGTDQSASAVDLVATAELLRAGYDINEAWNTIEAAHPEAMTHARSRGRAWWTQFHWNTAVATDTTWRTNHALATKGPAGVPAPDADTHNGNGRSPSASPSASPDDAAQTRAAVEHARAALGDLQWTWGPRQRHSTLLVAHTLLDRMTRTGTLRVPCPQRDLQLDTGLSRPTVAAALRTLGGTADTNSSAVDAASLPHGAQLLGSVHAAFDPTRRESSSHEFSLAARFLQIAATLTTRAPSTGASQSLPPVSHTPHRSGLWHHLNPPAHSLWRALLAAGPAGLPLQVLAQQAGLTASRNASPTTSQERTTRRHLAALLQVGLAHSRPDGTYVARPALSLDNASSASARTQQAARERQRIAEERIAIERHTYRTGAGTSWRRAHNAACATELKKARTRYDTWINSLSPTERRERVRHHAATFAACSSDEQRRLKERWARHRSRLGLNEQERHDQWCLAIGPQEFERRSIQRAAAFASLPGPDKAARVEAWSQHRARWNVSVGWPASPSAVRGEQERSPRRTDAHGGAPTSQLDHQWTLALQDVAG